jgi:hypothetical protein
MAGDARLAAMRVPLGKRLDQKVDDARRVGAGRNCAGQRQSEFEYLTLMVVMFVVVMFGVLMVLRLSHVAPASIQK